MPQPALFVGNGPNRAFNDDHSWAAVLEALGHAAGQPVGLTENDQRPFTLIFDELSLRCWRRGLSEDELKRRVAGALYQLAPNRIHADLMSLDVSHVLTTNYDYTLEAATNRPRNRADLFTESRYSLFRCNEVGRARVWHIHGEAERPPTIMLGHDQYVGYLRKARNYLVPERTSPKSGPNDHRSPVINERYDCEDRPEGYSWVDIFLRDDVHMVGFGLEYSEIAMWWLIGFKERLKVGASRVPKDVKVGETTFYYFEEEAGVEPMAGRLRVLHDLGVKLRRVPKRGSYPERWESLVRELRGAI